MKNIRADTVESEYTRLLARLRRLDGRLRRRSLGFRLLRLAGLLTPLVGLSLFVNLALPPAAPFLASLDLVALLGGGAAALTAAFLSLGPRFSARRAARRLSDRDPAGGEAALSAVELWELRGDIRHGYSHELLEVAVSRRAREFAALDADRVVGGGMPRRWSLLTAAGALTALLAVACSPSAVTRLAHGLWWPGKEMAETVPLPIEVIPGDCRVLAGDSLVVRARLNPAPAERESPGEEELWLEIPPVSDSPGALPSRRFMRPPPAPAAGYHSYTFDRVLQAFEYCVRSRRGESPLFRVELTERPRLEGITLIYHLPGYTREPARTVQDGDGRVVALRGTRVEVRARASTPLARASLRVGEDRPVEMTLAGAESSSAAGELVVTDNTHYRITLVSEDGYESLPTEPHPVVVLEDERPFVRLLKPAADVTLGPDLALSLAAAAVDDYGLSAAELHYQVSVAGAAADEPVAERRLELHRAPEGTRPPRELQLEHEWDLSPLELGPGDVVSYWVTVLDNDVILGPKEARTPTYQARFPSLEEIYAEVVGEEIEQERTLEEIAEEERELRERLEEISREALRDENLAWETRQELEQTLERQEEIQRELEEVIESLQSTAEAFEEHDLLSPEAVEKIFELQELLRQVATPEMLKAMEDLQRTLSQISPEELSRAMRELTLNQEEFIERLERTIALLKRYQMEQRLEELVTRAEELIERQDKLLEELADGEGREDLGPLATREERVAAGMEGLEEDVAELAEELRSLEPQAAGELDEATMNLEAEGVIPDLIAASRSMGLGQAQEAQSRAQRARGGQQNFRDQLVMAQSRFTEALRQEVMAELGRAARELVALSLAEEELVLELESSPGTRELVRGLADEQQDLRAGLERVADRVMALGEKTMLVTPDMARLLGRSLMRLEDALAELTEGRARPASGQGREAIVSMNEAAWEMMRARDQASSCRSATGMCQFSQSLQGMSCQQQGLNQETQGLLSQLQQQGGRLSQEARAQMARLAAEQRAISEALGDLLGEGDEGSQVLGRLDKALKEMRDTMQELGEGRVTRQTVERQKHILSRLLDAQRSVRRRDYAQRRRSRPGELTQPPPSPHGLPPHLREAPREFREDLLRALAERYPPEYEPLIRAYFRSLRSEEGP